LERSVVAVKKIAKTSDGPVSFPPFLYKLCDLSATVCWIYQVVIILEQVIRCISTHPQVGWDACV
jgi:hypothetical protein